MKIERWLQKAVDREERESVIRKAKGSPKAVERRRK